MSESPPALVNTPERQFGVMTGIMSKKRNTEQFKIKGVEQVTDRGRTDNNVARRLTI